MCGDRSLSVDVVVDVEGFVGVDSKATHDEAGMAGMENPD